MTDETTLAQIFSKPPPYSDDERRAVIAHYRASREQYLVTLKTPKEPKAKKPKVEAVDVSVGDIEL